jgi:hypothetical protein
VIVDGEDHGKANLQQYTFKYMTPVTYMVENIAVDFTGKESPSSPKFQYVQE